MAETKGLHVQGIEVTQAIQYYRSEMHLSDPVDRAPDNSVRLVANKPAWVRVYVRTDPGSSIAGVTGSLRVEQAIPEMLLADLNPQPPGTTTAFAEPEVGVAGPPFITPYTFYRWERNNLAATLNFVIPASLMCGHLRLTARVSAPDGHTHEMLTLVDATLRQQIRFRAILLGYNGPGPGGTQLAVSPPTLADLQAVSVLSLIMYPVSATAVYESIGTRMLAFPLGGNGCAPGDASWVELSKLLQADAAADGNRPGCIYYGLIAGGVPGGGGCNFGTAVASFTAQLHVEVVMAHEIGHYFQAHAPCGNPGDADANYPTYEPYDPASIGEYGLDINTGAIVPPDTHKDIMSYCKFNQWVSLYGHRKRLQVPLLNPRTVCDPEVEVKPELYYDPRHYLPDPTFPFVPAQRRPIISIVGIQDAKGEFTIGHVFRSVSYGQPRGEPTNVTAVLEDADGATLTSAPMFRVTGAQSGGPRCGCGDGNTAPFLLKATLDDVGPGAALRVLKDGKEVWRKQAPRESPRVTAVSAEVIDTERLAVTWRADGPRDARLNYWVRWSGDHGETWNGLGTGILNTQAEFSLEGLPAGEVQVHVVAHDGFFSVPSEPITVVVPIRPPIVTILHPKEGATLRAGGTLRLWAAVIAQGQEVESDAFQWRVDGREVARGLDEWVAAPAAGEHRCTLELRSGQSIARSVSFRTIAIGTSRAPLLP